MKLICKLNNNVTVEVEGETQSEVFKELASANEVFGMNACGVCKSGVFPRVRVVDDNAYHEMVCANTDCRAVLSYGANKKGGGLFPHRRATASHQDVKAGKLKEGDWLPNNGWTKWDGSKAK